MIFLLPRRSQRYLRPFLSKKDIKKKINLLVEEIKANNRKSDKHELIRLVTPFVSKICFTLPLTKQELISATDWVITKMLSRLETVEDRKSVV